MLTARYYTSLLFIVQWKRSGPPYFRLYGGHHCTSLTPVVAYSRPYRVYPHLPSYIQILSLYLALSPYYPSFWLCYHW